MRDSRLFGALVASAALHALVLFLFAGRIDKPEYRSAPPMVVRLAETATTPAAPAKPRPPVKKKAAVRTAATPEEFRLELIERARGEMRLAKVDQAWRGDVLVGVRLAANGRASVSLKESSGDELLDRHGVEAFARAARSLPLPPALRGREFALELRASYGGGD